MTNFKVVQDNLGIFNSFFVDSTISSLKQFVWRFDRRYSFMIYQLCHSIWIIDHSVPFMLLSSFRFNRFLLSLFLPFIYFCSQFSSRESHVFGSERVSSRAHLLCFVLSALFLVSTCCSFEPIDTVPVSLSIPSLHSSSSSLLIPPSSQSQPFLLPLVSIDWMLFPHLSLSILLSFPLFIPSSLFCSTNTKRLRSCWVPPALLYLCASIIGNA